jgi:hypothetical protein
MKTEDMFKLGKMMNEWADNHGDFDLEDDFDGGEFDEEDYLEEGFFDDEDESSDDGDSL